MYMSSLAIEGGEVCKDFLSQSREIIRRHTIFFNDETLSLQLKLSPKRIIPNLSGKAKRQLLGNPPTVNLFPFPLTLRPKKKVPKLRRVFLGVKTV